jgi:hypothetical protein
MKTETLLIFSCDDWKSHASMEYQVSVKSKRSLKKYLIKEGIWKKICEQCSEFSEMFNAHSFYQCARDVNNMNINVHIVEKITYK